MTVTAGPGTRRTTRALVALLALATLGAEAWAQQRPATRQATTRVAPPPSPAAQKPPATRAASIVVRADSAFDTEDRALARRLYAEALAMDSTLSRAVFRLAQLSDSPLQQLALYRRYEALQPRDAWGFMAEGDVLARLRRFDEGLAAYARAESIAPDERDVTIGRARLLERAGRSDHAVSELSRWTSRHADDGEAWDLMGRAALRSGRPRAAERAFARAESAGGVRGAGDRRAYARALATPAVEPIVGYQRDSDGNRASRLGGIADVMAVDGTRLGIGGERLTIGDGVTSSDGVSAFGKLSSRLSPGARLDVQGGAVRLASAFAGEGSWTTPQLDARLRLRAPLGGPSLELRAQRLALGTAPVLVENRVTRTDGRATVDLPAGWFRLRGTGRVGQMAARGESGNARYGADGALVLPLGEQVQLSGQYRVMGFQRASLAGYFAPRRAETIESGLYVETSGDGALSFAADVGGGAQRVAVQGANVGEWTRALRGWGYASLAIGAARALYAEVEAYDAPFAPEGVATSGTWRFVSLAVGVRWALP